MKTHLETELGRELALAYRESAMREIRDWARTSADMLKDSAERNLNDLNFSGFVHDWQTFHDLANSINTILGE